MSREYSVSADAQTVVAAPQLVFLNPAAAPSSGIELLRAWCSQRANATSAQQGIRLGTKASVFPTMVGQTPAKLKQGDPASGLVSGVGGAGTAGINSSVNGGGTETGIYADNFNVLNGWLWVATPVDTIMVRGGDTVGIFEQFTSTPGTLTGWSWGVVYREIG